MKYQAILPASSGTIGIDSNFSEGMCCFLPNGNKTRALSEDKCLDIICTNSFLFEWYYSREPDRS